MLTCERLLNERRASTVNNSIDLSTSVRDDHSVPEAAFGIPTDPNANTGSSRGKATKSNLQRLCPHKLTDPGLRLKFQEHLSQFSADPQSWDIDEHLGSFKNHISMGLPLFRAEVKKSRKAWLSDITWHTIQ